MPRLLKEAKHPYQGHYIGGGLYYYLGDHNEQCIYDTNYHTISVIREPKEMELPEPEIELLFKILIGNDF